MDDYHFTILNKFTRNNVRENFNTPTFQKMTFWWKSFFYIEKFVFWGFLKAGSIPTY
jgi:hypothetical protein